MAKKREIVRPDKVKRIGRVEEWRKEVIDGGIVHDEDVQEIEFGEVQEENSVPLGRIIFVLATTLAPLCNLRRELNKANEVLSRVEKLLGVAILQHTPPLQLPQA